MKWLKRLFAGLLALLMVAMVAVYLTPLDVYVPEVEKIISRQLGEPASVGHIRIAVMPLPHLELQDVRLGGEEGVVVQSVDAELDLPGLLAGNIVLRRIVVRDGIAHLVFVRKLVGLLAKAPAMGQHVAVREVQLTGMSLRAAEMALGPVDSRLEFTQAGRLERAWFSMDEQKITAVLKPLSAQPGLSANVPQPGFRFALKVEARGWAPPKFQRLPQIIFDELQVEGVLGDQDFVAQKFVVASRGIRIAGSGKAEFSDGWRVQATLTQADAPLGQVAALLGEPIGLTGALSVKGELSGKASTLFALKDNIHFSGDVLARHATVRMAAGFQRPLIFDQISARVVAQPDRVGLSSLEMKLYGGKLSGTANISRKNTMLVGDVVLVGIAMQPLVEALTNKVFFSGSMESAAKFSVRLDSLKHFPGNLRLTGKFHLRDGALSKVDLAQAASNSGKAGTQGGSTRFEDLTGLLDVDESGYHFRKLIIKSGSLNAEGKVDISPSLQISGMLDADVKGTAGLVSMPMVVSGTLNDPVIRPSGSALAGAAVGTAVLGPGLGTAIGVKVGGFLNKLFGKDDGKNNSKETAPKAAATK